MDVRLLVLAIILSIIEVVEVGHDDRHWQRYGQHAGDGTHRPDETTPRTGRCHVPVADRRHGNDGPPEGVWDALEGRLALGVRFGEEDGTREEDDADEEEEDEETELPHAGPDRLAEDLEALRVARQFEYPEDANESDDPEDGQRHGLVVGPGLVGDDSAEGDEVRNDGDDVDQVHEVLEEAEVLRRGGEPNEQLGREPDDADCLDDEERFAEVWNIVVLDVRRGVSVGVIDDADAFEFRQRL